MATAKTRGHYAPAQLEDMLRWVGFSDNSSQYEHISGRLNLRSPVVWLLFRASGLATRGDQLLQSLPRFPLPDPAEGRQFAQLLCTRSRQLMLPVVDRLGADTE
jgi:hypothetical protein